MDTHVPMFINNKFLEVFWSTPEVSTNPFVFIPIIVVGVAVLCHIKHCTYKGKSPGD